jgi:hypothetical protein
MPVHQNQFFQNSLSRVNTAHLLIRTWICLEIRHPSGWLIGQWLLIRKCKQYFSHDWIIPRLKEEKFPSVIKGLSSLYMWTKKWETYITVHKKRINLKPMKLTIVYKFQRQNSKSLRDLTTAHNCIQNTSASRSHSTTFSFTIIRFFSLLFSWQQEASIPIWHTLSSCLDVQLEFNLTVSLFSLICLSSEQSINCHTHLNNFLPHIDKILKL